MTKTKPKYKQREPYLYTLKDLVDFLWEIRIILLLRGFSTGLFIAGFFLAVESYPRVIADLANGKFPLLSGLLFVASFMMLISSSALGSATKNDRDDLERIKGET